MTLEQLKQLAENGPEKFKVKRGYASQRRTWNAHILPHLTGIPLEGDSSVVHVTRKQLRVFLKRLEQLEVVEE